MANNVEMEREGADITAADMIIPEEMPSDIQKFYEGSVLFITGASGLLGHTLLEKLLRSCSGVSKIYLLMRPKKGKDSEQRLEEMLKDPFFEKLMIENPKSAEKVSIILGDCEQPDLGLSEEDKQILIKQVNIVFHVAATVRFDETIRKAAYINIRCTRDLIKMGQEMRNLKSFVYVSTAFSNCTLPEVDEVFYDIEMTGDKLMEIVDMFDDDKLQTLTPSLIGNWPNTYTYTKAIAENVVRQYGQNLPVSIVRPAIVISSYKEPVAGWINNLYGPVGITIGAAVGVVRTLHCDPANIAYIVPVDYCINATIASAWVVGRTYDNDENKQVIHNVAFDDLKIEDNIPIFNYVQSPKTQITWGKYMSYVALFGLRHPSPLCVWYYCFYLTKNKYLHILRTLYLHFIPGFIFDAGLIATGKKPMFTKAYKKIHKMSDVLAYFISRQWIFKNNNTRTIWKQLNPTDKQLFMFDMDTMLWDEYFYTFVRGARTYLLKDPLDTLPQAQRRYKKLKFAHYTIVTIVYLLMLKLAWMVISLFL